MTMRFLTRVSALALTPIFSLSLAQMLLDGDLFSAESFSTDSDFFSNEGWQDSNDLTLAFNDVVYPADTESDTDLMIASGCGGENGKVTKLRPRGDANSFCDNWDAPQKDSENVKVPDILQPGEPGIGWLGTEDKTGNGKCVLPPYLQDTCCNGVVSTFWTMGPPRVWDSVSDCYFNPGAAVCPAKIDACCVSISEGTGFFCVVIGKTFEGIYTPIDPYTYFKTRKLA